MSRKPTKQERWKQRNPWFTFVRNARIRCTLKSHKMYYRYGGRGIKCLLTTVEVKALWFRDNAAAMKQPSLDRIDSASDYTFENCRFIELIDNIQRSNILRFSPPTKAQLRREFAGVSERSQNYAQDERTENDGR